MPNRSSAIDFGVHTECVLAVLFNVCQSAVGACVGAAHKAHFSSGG